MAKNQPKPILADSRYTIAQWIEGKPPRFKAEPKTRHDPYGRPTNTAIERIRGSRGSPAENRLLEQFRDYLHNTNGPLAACYEASFESGYRCDALFYTKNDVVCCEAKISHLSWREIGQAIGYGLETRSLAYSLGHESLTIHAVIVIKNPPARYPKQNLISVWTPGKGRISTGKPVHLWPKDLGFVPRKTRRSKREEPREKSCLAYKWLEKILGNHAEPRRPRAKIGKTTCKRRIEYLP